MRLKNTNWLFIALIGLVVFTACQKEVEADAPVTDPADTTATDTEADKIKDTVIGYTRDIYLWYDQIPASFNARSYDGPEEIMEAIRAYSIEPGFTNPVDRWSFAVTKAEWDDASSGIVGDFGLYVFFLADGDLRVRSVESASPAGQAGIRRGWRIVALNGSTNITIANASAIVEAVYYSASTEFTFEKPDGTTVAITLNRAEYQEHPVALDTVYTIANKNIGYMVFNSFLGDTTEVLNRFQESFSRFAAGNVGDVIVDLRYNGGGYVSLQNKLAGYLLPASAQGGVLMTQEYNDKYAAQLNSTTLVNKLGSLNLSRVFFIVGSNTASASELLINNLKPYMDVKLVGDTTHGKPVGYFGIPVGDWYIFPVSFRSTNKAGSGNYFSGISVDNLTADGLDKDWGDVNEACLAKTIKYITTGSFRVANERALQMPSAALKKANSRISGRRFTGMIDTPKKIAAH